MTRQDPPKTGTGCVHLDMVEQLPDWHPMKKLLIERRQVGLETYGTELGYDITDRDIQRDLDEELADAACYAQSRRDHAKARAIIDLAYPVERLAEEVLGWERVGEHWFRGGEAVAVWNGFNWYRYSRHAIYPDERTLIRVALMEVEG